jgi:hypothetical protein
MKNLLDERDGARRAPPFYNSRSSCGIDRSV